MLKSFMIASVFSRLASGGEKALIPFVMAGDPALDQLPAILSALEEGGADLIEVGLPFSDPIADGPTIQAAGFRALEAGTKHEEVLRVLADCKLGVPLVLMGYLNPMLAMGLTRFAQLAREAGVAGVIVCDVIPEEASEWCQVAQENRLDTIFLAAPTSTDERLRVVYEVSSGFVYAVSRTGVTGASASVASDLHEFVGRMRACTSKPICVGFGISKPEHVAQVCEVADGAVVGSFLVDMIGAQWNGGAGKEVLVHAMKGLKAATRRR